MAAGMDELSRSTSQESVRSSRSLSSGHILTAAVAPTHPSSARKGRYADIDTTVGETDRASISMPPPSHKPNLRYHTNARRPSRVSESAPLPAISAPHVPDALATDPFDAMTEQDDVADLDYTNSRRPPLSDSGIPATVGRSEPDLESNRMSFSSLYGSGRSAFTSGPSSVGGGSDQDAERATTAIQNLSVTTQSQNGALSPSLPGSMRDLNTYEHTSSSSLAKTASMATGRTVRDRSTPANSRRVSTSNPNSASHSVEPPNFIGSIGICALDAKARSKPARNILKRLVGKEHSFAIIIFGDKVILDEDVENWPVCEFLISFFSDGFPLEKAIAYAKLRKPFCVNDVPMQTILWDRRMCLTILDKLGVPTPTRVEVSRDGGPVALSVDIAQRVKQLTSVDLVGSSDGRGGGQPPPTDVHMEDDDDTLVVDGKKLHKPFVEKPTSGEDHNLNVYYPKSQGGGGRRLFRKVNNKSSEKDDTLVIPKAITNPEESYIYEQFLHVDNAEDVKAYTVGSEFCHAETRKSPVVDGVVKRNPNGKEIRYVTTLSKEEQAIAAKISVGFGQRVCGFDMLRVSEPDGSVASYVIDVNGWSFVKDNNDYYDNCAKILKELFQQEKRNKARAALSDLDSGESRDFKQLPPPASMSDKEVGLAKNSDLVKEKESMNCHRSALKDVFRSTSISQLRDSVHTAAQRVGHPHAAKSSSGTSSPVTSPSMGQTSPFNRRPHTTPPAKVELLPPPAVSHDDPISDTDRPISADLDSLAYSEAASSVPAPASKSQWKLKSIVAVIRHADRTPKQKFKFTFHTKPFVDLLKGHQEEVLLVGEAALNSVQQAVRQAMAEGEEDMNKLRTLQNALAKKGAWSGTKVQIKPLFKKRKGEDKNDRERDSAEKSKDGKTQEQESIPLVNEPDDVGPSQQQGTPGVLSNSTKFSIDAEFAGPEGARAQNRSDSMGDITMSRTAAADQNLVLDKMQLVIKWGGEPTHSARYQATDLGENMRNDLLLMNRRVMDDVSIYTSSERRVTTSAQIFASAFLDEKDIAPEQIRVRKDLLDDSNAAKDEMDRVKKKLKGLLRKGSPAPEEFAWPKDGTPEPYLVVRRVVELMKFHRRVMRHNFAKLQNSDAVTSLEKLQKSPKPVTPSDTAGAVSGAPNPTSIENQTAAIQPRWCTGEDAELFKERWEKLFNEFVDAEKVDPSKISELYDTMKFDALHNRQFLEWVFTPSPSILAEEKELEVGSRLKRTESMDAREEFQNTHSGQASLSITPVPNDVAPSILGRNGEMEILNLPPPGRSDTSNSFSSAKDIKQKDNEGRDRPSFSKRLGFRRKSGDLSLVAASKGAASAVEDPSQYFNLHKGNFPAVQSKLKNDARLEKLNELYNLSKTLFDFIGPQEYGITDSEKLEIGLLTSLPLLKEIVKDLEEVQASDDAKSFIYFTKESHIYTLLNCILEGGVQTKIARNAIPELDYLSQICFELYESENAAADIDPSDPHSNFNYSIRITISPGCHTFDPLDVQLDSKHCIGCAQRRSLTSHANWKEVLETLRAKFHTVKLPNSFTAVNLSERHPQDFVAAPEEDETHDEVEKVKIEGESVSQMAPDT